MPAALTLMVFVAAAVAVRLLINGIAAISRALGRRDDLNWPTR